MLYECFGGPLDGRKIADHGPRFTVELEGRMIRAGVDRTPSGYYERLADGYHWRPT